MYELARKHCGQQDEWAISLDLLRKETGSASSDKEFAGWWARFTMKTRSTTISLTIRSGLMETTCDSRTAKP